MSQTHAADDQTGVPEAIGAAMTGDAAMQTRSEFRLATMILGVIVLLIVATLALVWMFGLAAANLVALVGTALVFLILLLYASGR